MNHSFLTCCRPLVVAIAIAICVSACTKTEFASSSANDSPKVASVNGKIITKAMLDAYIDAVSQGQHAEVTDAQRDQVLDQVVMMQLAAEYADQHGAKTNKELQARIDLARLNAITDDLLKKYAIEHPASDSEIRAEYDTYVATQGREYHARHILVATPSQAKEIIAKLIAGADFAKLAQQFSRDDSSQKGGDLGWFARGDRIKPFSDAVAALEKGQFTQQPVQTQFGWHVIKLEDTRSPTPPAFDEVKDRAKAAVERRKVMAFVDSLKKAATIEKVKPAEAATTTPAAPTAAAAPSATKP